MMSVTCSFGDTSRQYSFLRNLEMDRPEFNVASKDDAADRPTRAGLPINGSAPTRW